ncbi:MAG: hypothetical protein ABF812_15500, partial [Gluconobacter cerinus]|uniref:hypothetical protein n=1 Tax=Gluconobacter cerinus TaxID=38307 RepID=UPI0039E7E027
LSAQQKQGRQAVVASCRPFSDQPLMTKCGRSYFLDAITFSTTQTVDLLALFECQRVPRFQMLMIGDATHRDSVRSGAALDAGKRFQIFIYLVSLKGDLI